MVAGPCVQGSYSQLLLRWETLEEGVTRVLGVRHCSLSLVPHL